MAKALAEAGFDREDVSDNEGFISGLCGAGVSEAEAHAYAEGVRRGGAVVAVGAADRIEANRAAIVMSRQGALDIEQCAAGWKARGWSGRFNAEAAIELETYVLVFGEYPAGAGRVYHVYRGPERRHSSGAYRGFNRRAT
jgi:hypothetical protein